MNIMYLLMKAFISVWKLLVLYKATDQVLIRTLKGMNLKPQVDEEGNIFIDHQLKTIYFMIDQKDDRYITVLFPGFISVTEDDRRVHLELCNSLTQEVRHIKYYIDPNIEMVSACYEFYFTDKQTLRINLVRALYLMSLAGMGYTYRKIDLEEGHPNESWRDSQKQQ